MLQSQKDKEDERDMQTKRQYEKCEERKKEVERESKRWIEIEKESVTARKINLHTNHQCRSICAKRKKKRKTSYTLPETTKHISKFEKEKQNKNTINKSYVCV